MFAAYCLLYCVVLALGSDSCAVCSVLFGVCCAMVCSWRLFGVQIRSGGCVVFAFDDDVVMLCSVSGLLCLLDVDVLMCIVFAVVMCLRLCFLVGYSFEPTWLRTVVERIWR